jgi:hypothetical protein
MKKIILRTLLIIGILIALSIGIVVYTVVITTQEKVVTSTIHYSGSFSYAPSGHLLIDVYLNGSKKAYPFFIDNAASTIIFDKLLKEVNLERVAFLPSRDANKNSSIRAVYRLDTLELENGIIVTDIAARSFSSEFFWCNDNVYGVIGKEVLEKFIWQFNFKSQTYTVTSNINALDFRENNIEIPFDTTSNYHDLIAININDNQKYLFDIDLGSTGGIRFELDEDSLAYFYKNKHLEIFGLAGYGVNGFNKSDNKNAYVFLDSIRIDGHHFYNIESSVANRAYNLVGLEFFKNFTTTLDFPNKRLILEPYDSLSFFPKHFGIAIKMDGQKLKVSSIIEKSIPHQQNIKIGDEVIKLNDLNVDNNFNYCGLFYDTKDTLILKIEKDGAIRDYIIYKKYLFKN